MRIVYSRKYNIGFFGFERLHPFDSRKYGRTWRKLKKMFGPRLAQLHLAPDRMISGEELELVHSPEYLSDKLNQPKYLAGALEIPLLRKVPIGLVNHIVVNAMKWATRGTVLAAEQALQHGLASNLSGGYHHAKPNHGEGFSIFSDIGVAIRSIRNRKLIGVDDRVLYIDTDAHQGNGVCHVFEDDPRVFIFDIFNSLIYPSYDLRAQRRIDCSIPMVSACSDQEYMTALQSNLPGFIDSVRRSNVGLAIYNAGTDVFQGDPLGRMNLSARAVLERDLFVVGELRQRQIPTVIVTSGGYTRESSGLIAATLGELIDK